MLSWRLQSLSYWECCLTIFVWQVGPSGKIGHTVSSTLVADNEAAQASHHNNRKGAAHSLEDKPRPQTGRNAQRQNTASGRQNIRPAKQNPNSHTPESRRMVHNEQPHTRNSSLDGDLAWPGQGTNTHPNVKQAMKIDAPKASRQPSMTNGYHNVAQNQMPPPPPPKQVAQRGAVAENLSSARSSPARSLANGTASKYTSYLASSPPQHMNGLNHNHLRGPQLSSSPLRPVTQQQNWQQNPTAQNRVYAASQLQTAVSTAGSSPSASSFEASSRRDPSSQQPNVAPNHVVAQNVGNSKQSHSMNIAAHSAGTSSASSQAQVLDHKHINELEQISGGWNPLQGSSATNSLIDWKHNTSGLQVLLVATCITVL